MALSDIPFRGPNIDWYPPHALEMWGAEIPKRPRSRVLSVTTQNVLDRPIGRPGRRANWPSVAVRTVPAHQLLPPARQHCLRGYGGRLLGGLARWWYSLAALSPSHLAPRGVMGAAVERKRAEKKRLAEATAGRGHCLLARRPQAAQAAAAQAAKNKAELPGLVMGFGLLGFSVLCALYVSQLPGWWVGGLPRAACAAMAVALSWTAGGYVSRFFGIGK